MGRSGLYRTSCHGVYDVHVEHPHDGRLPMSDGDVVDPIRVPDWLRDRARRAWSSTPLLARGFVGLAILDVLARWFGILQPPQSSFLDLRGLYAFFFPRELWILLPAILL